MNALVNILGKQYKIKKGDLIRIPYIDKKIGDKVIFEKILFSEDGSEKVFGKPYVKNLSIEAKLVKQEKEPKITVFKFKRRKGYQKKSGHQQKVSIVEILKFKRKSKPVNKKVTETTKTASKPKKATKSKASSSRKTTKSEKKVGK